MSDLYTISSCGSYITIALIDGFEKDGSAHTSINLRRIKVGDQLAAARAHKNDEDKEMHILASVTGLSPNDLAQLTIDDYELLGIALNDWGNERKKEHQQRMAVKPVLTTTTK